jgi:beta-lactamase class A
VKESEGKYLVVFENGIVPTKITVNKEGQINGLFFQSPQATRSNLEATLESFTNLSGQLSLLVMEDGQELLSINPNVPLSVGSTFKLAVLCALKRQVESKERSWDEVIELQPNWKTLPSGVLQNWPDGAPLTLHTLAALMISGSDNTAAEALMNLVGRRNVEDFAPRNRPFLTPREAFILRDPANRDLLEGYRNTDESGRLMVLKEAQGRSLPTTILDAESATLDVEWFFTAHELCSLMEPVASLPLMSINTGPANPEDWAQIAFKGGSDLGVLNLTTWLLTWKGKAYCVTATWNDNTPLDEAMFFTLYGSLLNYLNR